MKPLGRARLAVAYNRDFEGAEADPENRAREDIKATADDVLRILRAGGYDAVGVGVTGDVLAAVEEIKDHEPAAVFNLCESIQSDNRFEALLPLLLDLAGLPYTGSDPFTLGLALHKDKAKDVLRSRGISTPRGYTLTSAETSALDLRFPVMVKPTREDASVGISSASVVHDLDGLQRRVRHVIDTYRQPVMVEEFIEGREIYVSMLGRPDGDLQLLPFFEIDFSDLPADRPRIVSFEGKWVEDSPEYKGTKSVRCEGLAPCEHARVSETARSAFRALEVRDYGRLDVRLDATGVPYVIDVNPNCDLSDRGGGFAKAAKAAGLSYEALIGHLVDLAISRGGHGTTYAGPARPRHPEGLGRLLRGQSVPPGGDLLRARAARRRARSG